MRIRTRRKLNVPFVSADITVDGVLDAAYASAPVSAIGNVMDLEEKAYAADPSAADTTGTLRAVWDGPLLYLFVEVTDPTLITNDTAPTDEGAMSTNPAVPTDRDSVVFAFDYYNDKVVYETDTIGAFTIDSSGYLTYYRNSSINSLSAVHADPTHPEYTDRIHSYAATKTATGYNVEIALQIEGSDIKNGRQFGVEVQLCNVETLAERTVKTANPWYIYGWGPEYYETHYDAGPAHSGNTFWSHAQESLYTEMDHERPNAVDWGTITLTGWNGTDSFAFSNWRLTSNLDYLNSIRFPKGVWRQDTQTTLDAAVSRAQSLVDSGATSKALVNSAADQLEAAIDGLRWADTTYPDPNDLPELFTLPNPYKFFGSDGTSTRVVMDNADWEKRREEILDLAQFYEYGYKPGAPDSMSISVAAGVSSGWGSKPDYTITYTMTYGITTKSIAFDLYLPTSGRTTNVPVVLSFDGSITQYLEAGIAVLSIPSVTGSSYSSDIRTNEYAWGTRTGVFYELFPYARNGQLALNEVSSEMAGAWSASRAIDAVELLTNYKTLVGGKDLSGLLDPDKLAVTGFSINGKMAFVSAVFDDRIDVCIPGAAGATGPSPWRYVYAGQEYDWSSTVWAPLGAAQQVSFGTEFMANSIRHNRIRETELFRHFLTFENFYAKLDGAYGYGARLPYDQNDLVATLAPRAIVLESTVNDYNDGSVADGFSLDIAKSVYTNLGYDADTLVRYNYRVVQPSGDPHGSDSAQRTRTAEFLNYYFYGDTMSADTDTWLSTNPYDLKVSNNKTESPYDYYWGGYNTATGGTGGVDGRNGWYYYTFPVPGDLQFTKQPEDAYVLPGDTAEFTALATGFKNLTYSWEVFKVAASDWEAIPGANGTILTINGAALKQSGNKYRVVVTDEVNGTTRTLTSNSAILVVGEPPQTGDDSKPLLMLLLGLAAAAGITIACVRRYKRKAIRK